MKRSLYPRGVVVAVLATMTTLLAPVATGASVAEAPAAAVAGAAAGELGGYWMVDASGEVYAFGSATHLGEGATPTVAMAATRDGSGYWLVTAGGLVVARGSAPELGSAPPLAAGEEVVGITANPSGPGAWLFTSAGGVHARGGAPHHGDARALPLNQPVVSGVATPGGDGYWLVAADGGVFSYGAARFHGSTGGMRLNGPVIGLVPTPAGGGYWLLATDGGVFSFGTAPFHGSMGHVRLNQPMRGMVSAGQGYLMVAADGGVFAFGPGVGFHGSLGAEPPSVPVVGLVPVPAGTTPRPLGEPAFWSSTTGVDASRLAHSWRPGCPVGPAELRLVTADHWDMTGRLRTGEVVVHRDHAAGIVQVLRALHGARFPIARMDLVDRYGGDDGRSMAADNTSAFNCRRVAGSATWSEHAYGRAIDINPVENPYVRGDLVDPPAGRRHLDRTAATPGLIRDGDAVVRAFAAIGWRWGGHWASARDLQHFSATGR